MSKIDEQIQELLRKKKKTELFWHILESLADYKNPEFDEVKEEVLKEVQAFVDAQIAIIEDGQNSTGEPREDDVSFSTEEVKILKKMVKQLLTKTNTTAPQSQSTDDPYKSQSPEQVQAPKKPVEQKQDKIQFALAHRHLANKRVEISTKDGPVYGQVVGIDAPHIIVKTDTGHTAPVPLENMRVVQ